MTSRLVACCLAVLVSVTLAACGGDSGEPRPDLLLVSSRDGDYAIYALDADGANQKRLTPRESDPSTPEGLFFQTDPAWSPDGRRIAFASKRSGSFDIYVMNADGTGTRRLTTAQADETHPTWSPDGSRIAYEHGARDIYVMSSDGTGAKRITDDEASEGQPAWSPEGDAIAYSRRTPGTPLRELWLVAPDGSNARRVTSLGAITISPTWSPDATRLAFASDVNARLYDVYVHTLGRKGVRRLTHEGPDTFEPAWSPDGSVIAYSQNGSIWTVDLEGGVEELTDPDGNDAMPAWNPVLAPAES
jgi:Tol biopolymer transport system component